MTQIRSWRSCRISEKLFLGFAFSREVPLKCSAPKNDATIASGLSAFNPSKHKAMQRHLSRLMCISMVLLHMGRRGGEGGVPYFLVIFSTDGCGVFEKHRFLALQCIQTEQQRFFWLIPISGYSDVSMFSRRISKTRRRRLPSLFLSIYKPTEERKNEKNHSHIPSCPRENNYCSLFFQEEKEIARIRLVIIDVRLYKRPAQVSLCTRQRWRWFMTTRYRKAPENPVKMIIHLSPTWR